MKGETKGEMKGEGVKGESKRERQEIRYLIVSCDWDGWLKFGILVGLMWFNSLTQ